MSTIETTARSARPKGWLDEASEEYELPDLPFTPREGWISVLALGTMLLAAAVAIDDALWVGQVIGTRDSQTGFLPLAALASLLLGAYLAKTTLSIWRAHLIGILVGALTLLFFVSNSISRAPTLEGRLHELNLSVSIFVSDVFVQGSQSRETSIFLLIMGAIIWGAGLFCAMAVFRRHKPLPAIVLAGGILLLNVSLTLREQYLHLLLFAAAALVLAMRLNLREQAHEWRVRGMRDVADISRSFMRSGAVFVAVAVIGSSLLATNASSAPLSRAFSGWDDELLEFGYTVNRWLGGVTGSARGPNVLFTPSQTIRDFWQSSNEEVFSARISDGKGRRWRGATYDSFDGRSWQQLERQAVLREADEGLLAGTPEAVAAGPGRTQVTVHVLPIDYGGDVFVAPETPLSVSQPTELTTRGKDGAFVNGKLTYGIQPGVTYSVTSLVRSATGPGALTASQLSAAGAEYPDWVKPYLDIRPDSIGDIVYDAAQEVFDSLRPTERDPYHAALAVQDYLYSSGGFKYTTDLRGACAGEELVDCFMRIKKGYCEYFATAMTMMLRTMGVPARYVLGYLPGQEQADGTWRVDRGAAHAWVEVYFPRFGWVEFDPTPGNTENGQAPTNLPAGGPVATNDPGGLGFPQAPDDLGECAFGEDCTNNGTNEPPIAAPGTNGPTAGGVLPLVLIFGAVLLAAGVAAWTAWRRIPSTKPELAYSGITRIAARLGYGPRPSQTPYEYTARLSDLVPVVRSDLMVLATAKVEAAYGRRQPGSVLLLRIAEAYRHARTGLLRLIFRRPRLGRKPRAAGKPRITTTRR
ncbi:MAG TPA: transglutaminaseTgpA domain-containing protein [Candidatus Limnocylindria bacterium]|nr:transglutaminaseTgpA domain-containing protein [Candidatus Limnocylindria bacterium]